MPFYIVGEILSETSKMLHYYEGLWGIGILSKFFKRIGDTEKLIINSLDGGEEGALPGGQSMNGRSSV